MSKIDLTNLMNQLSDENMNLVVNKNIIAGSNSGSWWTISGDWPLMEGATWSISDLWDTCDCME